MNRNNERQQQGPQGSGRNRPLQPNLGPQAQGIGQGYGEQPFYGAPLGRGDYEGEFGRYPYASYGEGREPAYGGWRGMGGPTQSDYLSQGFAPQHIRNQYIGTESGYPGSGFQSGLASGYVGGLGAQAVYGHQGYGQPGYGPMEYGQRRAEFGGYAGQAGDLATGYPQTPGQAPMVQTSGLSFRGRGPKGYTRSDDRIKEDLCERLTEDHLVDASDITVEVRQGVVTLTGAVDSRQLKHRIEDLVEDSLGVKDIENRLTVRNGGLQAGAKTSAGPGATGAARPS